MAPGVETQVGDGLEKDRAVVVDKVVEEVLPPDMVIRTGWCTVR